MDIERLERDIKHYAELYYNGVPAITDAQFDALVDQLRKVKPDSQVLKTGWGFEVKGNKVKHKYTHIGSLDKCKTYQVPYLEVDPLEMDQLTSKNLVALSILNKDFAQKIWNDRKGMVIVDGLQQTKKETEPQSLCTKQQSSAAHKKG